MRSIFLVITLFLMCVGTVKPQQIPTGNIQFKKLPNGLEIVVVKDSTVPLVTIEIACRNGSFTENEEYNGLSHLYEHLFFKANKDYPSYDSFTNRSNELDIKSNARTQEEVVSYYFTLPAGNLDLCQPIQSGGQDKANDCYCNV